MLIVQLMICFGISLTWLIGAFVNWRALALIGRTPIPTYVILKLKMKMVEWEVIFHYPDYVTGSVPCVIQLVGLPFIPESPRWLVRHSQLHYVFFYLYLFEKT